MVRIEIRRMVVWFLLIAALFAVVTHARADEPVEATLTADRAELTVGDPVQLTLEVTHPDGYQIIIRLHVVNGQLLNSPLGGIDYFIHRPGQGKDIFSIERCDQCTVQALYQDPSQIIGVAFQKVDALRGVAISGFQSANQNGIGVVDRFSVVYEKLIEIGFLFFAEY